LDLVLLPVAWALLEGWALRQLLHWAALALALGLHWLLAVLELLLAPPLAYSVASAHQP
jgi:hypothetical protein